MDDRKDTPRGNDIREFSWETTRKSFNLCAKALRIGEDWLVAAWGGDKPHIGAVAIAHPRPSLEDSLRLSASSSVYCFLGHKEDALAKELSEKLAAALDTNVTVTAGMHWNGLKTSDLPLVSASFEELTALILEDLTSLDRT